MFTPHRNSHASSTIRVILSLTLILSSLPSQGVSLLSAQTVKPADKPVQSRPDTPHKDLPNPQDLLDEGKGLKKTKAKDTPLQPPSLCRYRDVDCLEQQRKNGGKISTNTNAPNNPNQSQVASTAPKSAGHWFPRLGQKLSGAISRASATMSSSNVGHSFLPAATAPAAPPPPPPSFASLNEAKLDPHNRSGTGGEDLFSGNYHWSTPLVSLPGRGGWI